MELENFLNERNIDPKIIAVLIDLKEPLDEIIEYLKEHNLEMDGCTFEYKDNTYWVYDQKEADERTAHRKTGKLQRIPAGSRTSYGT